MQLFHLPAGLALALCFLLWPIFQVSAALLCRRLTGRFLNPEAFWFRQHRWENGGLIYERLFRIRSWKRLLPDGGTVTRGGYAKRHITDFSEENLKRFLTESCRAELTHLSAVPPFILFGLFLPPAGIALMFVYAAAVNLPCAIAQRYNRPRVKKLLAAVRDKAPHKI